VARAIASVGAGTDQPLQVNVYGVETNLKGNARFLGDQRPQRTVWYSGAPLSVLAAVLERRLIDAEAMAPLPLGGPCPCGADSVSAFLANTLDFEEIARWIPPLSLINWRRAYQTAASPLVSQPPDGAYLLHSLFRPLFHPPKIYVDGGVLFPEELQLRAVTTRRLLNLIRGEAWEEAIRMVRDRYLAVGRMTVAPPPGIHVNGECVAAALLIPMSDSDVAAGFRRWLQPTKNVNP